MAKRAFPCNFLTAVLLVCFLILEISHCILYPRDSETRSIKDIGGKWKFRIDDSPSRHESFNEKWWNISLADSNFAIDMPVPASYNDITQDRAIRDFTGWAWYQRDFFVPSAWQNDCLVWLRIGSAHYNSIVWINAEQVMTHEGGHLPFEAEVSQHLVFGHKNKVTVAVNNTLTPTTLPPGTVTYKSEDENYPPGYFVQDVQFDFFNYAGIHRPVKLYTTPTVFIKDIDITTSCDVSFEQCQLKYSVDVRNDKIKKHAEYQKVSEIVHISILDASGTVVASEEGNVGTLIVNGPVLWWPIGMNKTVAYLYTAVVEIEGLDSKPVDIYRQPIGIRTVEVKGSKFLVNGRPFYFLGVGKHEDWDVRGKGFDWSSVIKDFNMLEWIGANSFRTSHYPYAEEIMQLCDERGFVVVDESPAVGLQYKTNFVNKTLYHHLRVMEELVSRDKNHPSVVMWSVANEPQSTLEVSKDYFRTVITHTRSLDSQRPVTFVANQNYDTDLATEFVDVVSVNKYSAWYEDSGHPEVIQKKVGYFLSQWYETRHKPVIHMEWGAGTVAGMHADPPVMFTEEYQEEVMLEHFKVFDSLRGDFLAGEMIWNFADFATEQGTTRVVGNKKGVLTRQREPKAAASIIRRRYHTIRNETLTHRRRFH